MKKQKGLPNNTVKVATAARELCDGVIGLAKIKPISMPGSKVFVYFLDPDRYLFEFNAAVLD